MTQYLMKIREKFIDSIQSGIKQREYRLNDDSRRLIQVNDTLVLVSSTDKNRFIRVKVTDCESFTSWREALSKYWIQDFQNVYSSLEQAIDECEKFYNTEEVNKYGIIVFSIKPEAINLQNSNILLDANIVVREENFKPSEIEMMYQWFNQLKCNIFIQEDDIESIKSLAIDNKENVLRKFETYQVKSHVSFFAKDFNEALVSNDFTIRNKVMDSLLYELYIGAIDFFITDDEDVVSEARALYLQKYVLTSKQFLHLAELTQPTLIDYKMMQVKKSSFGDVDLSDSFFDTLKEDYAPSFTKWFEKKRKNNEPVYVYKNGNSVEGFLYLKYENEKEEYKDIVPAFLPKRRLKIGTFKIISTGFRVGERFLKYIFDNAINNNVQEIYVTLFEDKRSEITALSNFLKKWGFVKWGMKNNEETVLVKKMGIYDIDMPPKFNYPNLKKDIHYFFLPIKAEFHTDLFPDSIMVGESETLYSENKAHRYSIEKIYVTNASYVRALPGDIVLIYRIGDRAPKSYFSAVTGIAILQEIICPKNMDEYLHQCKNITVFSTEQLTRFYNQSKYRTIVKLLYCQPLAKKVILNDLYKLNAIEKGTGPRGFTPITKDQFRSIIEKSKGENVKYE